MRNLFIILSIALILTVITAISAVLYQQMSLYETLYRETLPNEEVEPF